LRQRLELILPSSVGALADTLDDMRALIRQRWPDAAERRRRLAAEMAAGGLLDPLAEHDPDNVLLWVATEDEAAPASIVLIGLTSFDPDELTLHQARALAQADRVLHTPDVPPAILDRARADAPRIVSLAPPVEAEDGLTVFVEMAR
jgi:uroporphyrin-III C-methyltransferase/precorrin-2 dehydrogenase/sirohydrochlorin ferrochelatase